MKSLTRSTNIANNNLNNGYFNNYISSSPNLYSEPSLQQNNLINQSPCNCSCHCQEKKCRKFHRDTSCKNILSNKYKDLNIVSISDNNMANEKKKLIKHKSQNNLISSPNNKLYLFQEMKKNYIPNYNYTTSNNYINLDNNTIFKNSNYSTSNNNRLKNHSFVDIKEINNNTKKEDEIKYYRVQLKRKQLSKFYHNIGIKKYHYGYGKIQTTNKTNNHKYTEIYGTSGSNKENTNNKRSIKINYILNTDENNPNIYNMNENEKYNNHRYSCSNDFDRNNNYQINSEGKSNDETQSRILKETYNTRLIEVKSPSKEKNYAYRSSYNLNESRKNLFNSYQRKTEYNNRKNNTNSRYSEYKTNNMNVAKKYNNAYTNKPKLELDISNSNEISNNNYKRGFTKYTHVPYALSLGNRLTEQNNICYNNNTNQEKKMNLLRNNRINNRINNINYKILKQKVRLSLLKKQIYEQKRNMLFNNNKGYYNPNLIINDNLCEKTRQLMNKDNYPDVVNNYNYEENFE